MGYINGNKVVSLNLNSHKIFKILYNSITYAVIVVGWESETNIQVLINSDIEAKDMEGNFDIISTLTALLNSETSISDMTITYANQTTINTIIGSFEAKDIDMNYWILSPNIIANVDASGIAKDFKTSIDATFEYAIREMTTYEIVELLMEIVQLRVSFDSSLDVAQVVKDLKASILANYTLSAILDNGIPIDFETVYTFILDYDAIMETSDSINFAIDTSFYGIFNIDLDTSETNDLASSFSANSLINALIKVLRDAYISDYANETLEDLSSETLEDLILFEI